MCCVLPFSLESRKARDFCVHPSWLAKKGVKNCYSSTRFKFFFPTRGGSSGVLTGGGPTPLKHTSSSTTSKELFLRPTDTHFSSSKVGEEMTAPRVRKQPSSPDCSTTSSSSGVRFVRRECVKRNSYMWRKLFNNCITILQQVNPLLLLPSPSRPKGEEESGKSEKYTHSHSDVVAGWTVD